MLDEEDAGAAAPETAPEPQSQPDGGADKGGAEPSANEKGLLAAAAEKAAAEKAKEKEADGGEGESPLGKVNDGGEKLDGKDAKPEGKDDGDKPYYPEGLPEHLQGKDDKDTIDKITKAYEGARKALAKNGELPKEASGYETPEGVPEDDPGLQVFKEVAFKYGLSQETYKGLMADITPALMEAGIIVDPPNPAEEVKKLGDEGPALLDQTVVFADKLLKEGHLNDELYNEFLIMGGTANGIKVFNILRQYYGEKEIPVMSAPVEGVPTESELRRLKADPRAIAGTPEFDQDFANEVERKFQKFYGDKPAGTSRSGFA